MADKIPGPSGQPNPGVPSSPSVDQEPGVNKNEVKKLVEENKKDIKRQEKLGTTKSE